MQVMEIRLKIIDGNIPYNFPNGVKVMFCSEGMQAGIHGLSTLFFYKVRGGDKDKIRYTSGRCERDSIVNHYFYNYLHIFINSDITKGTEIDVPVGFKYNPARLRFGAFRAHNYDDTYVYEYKYFLTIKKI